MRIVSLCLSLVVYVLLSVFSPAVCADRDREQKVLILPPAIHGPTEMTYLSQGLVDMLTTRLTDPGNVIVVPLNPGSLPSGPVTKAVAAASARQSGADHVVFGSLTLLGNSISTDLRMLNAATTTVSVAFSQSGGDPASIIDHANLFAAEAQQKVFGRAETGQVTGQYSPQMPETSKAPTDPVYQHPEKLLHQPMVLGEDDRYRSDDIGAGIIDSANSIRGPRINGQVQSLAIGDIDGDGTLDTVIAGLNKLWVYKFTNGRFVKMADLKSSGNYIGVDVADINENGRGEIFVTNFDNDNGQVSSFVVEYDGRKLNRTHKMLDLYFRAINVPMRGRVLFGQRQGLDTLFQTGVYEIIWENGKYRRGSRLKLPRSQNIFGLGLGTMPPSPENLVFSYDTGTRLQIMDNSGNQDWISTQGYGNVAAFVKTKTIDDLSGNDYHYINGRIEMLDLDGDGGEEAIVLRNEDITSNFTKRTRLFKHGRIEILKTDQLGMSASLLTRYLPKFISDFAVGDLDGDGKPEILTAIVQKAENVASRGRSNIYLFNLDGLPKSEVKDR